MQNSGKALHEKGFRIKCTESEDDFIDGLAQADVAWVVSSEKAPSAKLVDACVKFQESGKGLALWADNDPYVSTINGILEKLDPKVKLSGNTPGSKTLNVGEASKKGEFKRHIITSGIAKLFEGITLCYPQGDLSGSLFDVVATSSDGHPSILYADYNTDLPPSSGRILLDCGFTKLYHNFDTAGTARYIRNVCVWLLGIDHRLAIGAELQGEIPKSLARKAHHTTKDKKKRTTKVSKKTNKPVTKKRRLNKEEKDTKKDDEKKDDEKDDENEELKWVWQYQHNGWYNYDSTASDVVETVYQDYLKNPRQCDVRSVASGEWKYMVDFRALTQQNIQHENHTSRNIRRVQLPLSDLSLKHKKRYL